MPDGQIAQESSQPRFRIENYGYRNFAVYDKNQLVVVTVYKRGAIEVAKRLDAQDGGGFEIIAREKTLDYINPFH